MKKILLIISSTLIFFIFFLNISYAESGCVYNNGNCIKEEDKKNPTQICQENYGINSYSDGKIGIIGDYNCYCKEGFVWNINNSSCIIKINFSNDEKEIANKIFIKIKNKVSKLSNGEKVKFYNKLESKINLLIKKNSDNKSLTNTLNYLYNLIDNEIYSIGIIIAQENVDSIIRDIEGGKQD